MDPDAGKAKVKDAAGSAVIASLVALIGSAVVWIVIDLWDSRT